MKLLLATLLSLAIAPAAAGESVQEAIAQCAACHGVDGIARSADVPHLAGQQEQYLYLQLLNFRTGKRPHKEMRVMSRQMTDADMRAIAAYYAAMPR